MNKDLLKTITRTVEGYEVKNLRFVARDNLIVGQVKDPLWGKANLHDGYIGGAWRLSGYPTNSIKNRNDLKLEINFVIQK